MKHTLVIVLFAALTATSIAHTYTDTAGGSWTGNLDFNGKITNENPIWLFEVPMATQALATDMDKLVIDGMVVGTNTTWNIGAITGLPILTGLLPNTPRGAGLTPVITIGEQGSTITADSACESNSLCNVTLTATGADTNNNPTADGTLTLSLEQGLALALTAPTGVRLRNANGVGAPNAAPIAVQLNTDAMARNGVTAYDDLPYNTDLSGGVEGFVHLTSRYRNINAAVAIVQIGPSVLSFPTALIPATWTASLPIEIVVQ